MKKILSIFVLLACILNPTRAEHIKGGEISYVYMGDGASPNSSIYRVTLKLYIDCNARSPEQLETSINFTVFQKSNNAQYGNEITALMAGEEFIQFDPNSNPCIGNPPTGVCYRVRRFSFTITLPNTPSGYTIAYQRCCRIRNIVNLVAPSDASGATYTCDIPGTDVYPDAYKNNSPVFVTNDAAAICVNSSFLFSFAAEQSDDT